MAEPTDEFKKIVAETDSEYGRGKALDSLSDGDDGWRELRDAREEARQQLEQRRSGNGIGGELY